MPGSGLKIAALLALAAPAPASQGRAQVALGYPAPQRVRLVSPSGRIYVATLTPEPDVNGDIGSLDLDLDRPGRRGARSLLWPPGMWHGMQPFYFAAADLAKRRGGVIYPNPRSIPISGTRERLEVRVIDARVHPTGRYSPYVFDSLRIVLAIRRR